jgi:PAS domain S-box-containing protein
VRVNKQFENLFHVTAEQIKGKTAADIFPPDTAAAISRNDAEVISKAAAVDMEEIYPEDDGLHTFLTVTFPLFTTKGRMYGISRISTDITERKRLEEELHESEQRLKAILASIGEGVIVADTDGRFLLYNPVAEMLTGMGATEGPVSEWSQTYGVFQPEDMTTLMPVEEMPLFKAIKGEKSNNVEMFIRNANVPEGRFLSSTGTPITDADGKLMGGVVVMRDVTEQRQLEKLLMENDKQLRTVISSIGEGIVVTDPKGRYLLLNPKAEELLGISALDASSTHWPLKSFLFEADGETPIPPDQQPLARALKGEAVQNMNVVVRHPKLEHSRYLSVNAHPLRDEHRAISAAIADFRDITEVRRLEETVQQIEKRYRSLLGTKPTEHTEERVEEL